jgi:hypothetical protein
MQVSPIFNSIAAPLLYRIITIDPNTPSPYATFPRFSATLQRLTMDKMANLKYIDEVNFLDGEDWCQHKPKIPPTFTLNVSMLRVYRNHAPDEKCCAFPNGRCECTDFLRPKKIIYLDTISQHVHYLQPNKPKVGTITTLFRQDPVPIPFEHDFRGHIVALCHYGPIASQLIFVFPSNSSPRMGPRSYYASIWSFLRPSLFRAASIDDSSDIVIVNIESFVAVDVPEVERDGKSDAEVATTATDKAYAQYQIDFGYRNTQSTGRPRIGQFKFVSIQTYLENYDWKGVFTDEEVELYLRDRDKNQVESE